MARKAKEKATWYKAWIGREKAARRRLRGRKNRLRGKRRRRIFLQGSNRSKNRSSGERRERQRSRAKTRFDRG
jgi:hypothetical protein